MPSAPVVSLAKPIEVELDPYEVAPSRGGYAQSAGVRPSTPFARAVDHNPAGGAWKRHGRPAAYVYCPRCGIALPLKPRAECENCVRK